MSLLRRRPDMTQRPTVPCLTLASLPQSLFCFCTPIEFYAAAAAASTEKRNSLPPTSCAKTVSASTRPNDRRALSFALFLRLRQLMGRKHEVNNSDLWVILRGHSAPTATASLPPRPPSLASTYLRHSRHLYYKWKYYATLSLSLSLSPNAELPPSLLLPGFVLENADSCVYNQISRIYWVQPR